MADKGLNLFDKHADEFKHLCPQEEECNSGNIDGIRHLNTLTAISNEMPVLLLILC